MTECEYEEGRRKRGADGYNQVSCEAIDGDLVHYLIQCHPFPCSMSDENKKLT